MESRRTLGDLADRVNELLTRVSREATISIDDDRCIVVGFCDINGEIELELEVRILLSKYWSPVHD
jgi:hypothetical protein